MKPGDSFLSGSSLAATVLGLLAALIVLALLTGRRLPLISSDRAGLVALAVIGFLMCTLDGINQVVGRVGWVHPVTLIGSVLGALILLVVVAALAGIKLPLVASARQAVIAVAAMGLAKWVLAVATRLLVSKVA